MYDGIIKSFTDRMKACGYTGETLLIVYDAPNAPFAQALIDEARNGGNGLHAQRVVSVNLSNGGTIEGLEETIRDAKRDAERDATAEPFVFYAFGDPKNYGRLDGALSRTSPIHTCPAMGVCCPIDEEGNLVRT